MKPKLIFIEGVDRSGKGTLSQAIHEATGYKHVIFDRGVISNQVYSITQSRFDSGLIEGYTELEAQLSNTRHIVIYIDCKTCELERRAKETNHEKIDFDTHKQLFESFINTTCMNVIKVDTTKLKAEEIVQELISKGVI